MMFWIFCHSRSSSFFSSLGPVLRVLRPSAIFTPYWNAALHHNNRLHGRTCFEMKFTYKYWQSETYLLWSIVHKTRVSLKTKDSICSLSFGVVLGGESLCSWELAATSSHLQPTTISPDIPKAFVVWVGTSWHQQSMERSASVVNAHLVNDPTIRQSGFALPRQQWSLLNRFCTGQGHCGVCKKKWKLSDFD